MAVCGCVAGNSCNFYSCDAYVQVRESTCAGELARERSRAGSARCWEGPSDPQRRETGHNCDCMQRYVGAKKLELIIV